MSGLFEFDPWTLECRGNRVVFVNKNDVVIEVVEEFKTDSQAHAAAFAARILTRKLEPKPNGQ